MNNSGLDFKLQYCPRCKTDRELVAWHKAFVSYPVFENNEIDYEGGLMHVHENMEFSSWGCGHCGTELTLTAPGDVFELAEPDE